MNKRFVCVEAGNGFVHVVDSYSDEAIHTFVYEKQARAKAVELNAIEPVQSAPITYALEDVVAIIKEVMFDRFLRWLEVEHFQWLDYTRGDSTQLYSDSTIDAEAEGARVVLINFISLEKSIAAKTEAYRKACHKFVELYPDAEWVSVPQ